MEEERLKQISDMAKYDNISWETLLSFDEYILDQSGWKLDIVDGEEVGVRDNIQREEVVNIGVSGCCDGSGEATIPNRGEYSPYVKEEKYTRLDMDD